MRENKRRGAYSLVMVLVVLVIGGSFVGLAFQMVESRHRFGMIVMDQKKRYNSGVSAVERAKGWIHSTITLTGKLPMRISTEVPVKVSDLLIRSADGYVIYDLTYPSLGSSMDASFTGFPKMELSSFGGEISTGDYASSAGNVSSGTGEGPGNIGIYLIRSFSVEGGGYEVVVSEGL